MRPKRVLRRLVRLSFNEENQRENKAFTVTNASLMEAERN